jgi:hypothetical protein
MTFTSMDTSTSCQPRSPCHCCPKGLLPLEEMGFSLSDQNVRSVNRLLTLFYQTLCNVPYVLRPCRSSDGNTTQPKR